MTALVEERLRTNTTSHWTTEFVGIGVPAGPVHLAEELLQDAQAWENGYFVRLDHELLGGITVVAPPVKFSDTPFAAGRASQPLGAQTREVLEEAGLSRDAINELLERGAASQWR
jgi:crotonobetainyl-CoA:carnitine CoA-transferase CaiB-like acyl-CoA transferase